ncbi:MAG: ribonuclease P protein component [Clostridia bacterium]|nr:ribonuclease P protein component [Clostridia bacterium]
MKHIAITENHLYSKAYAKGGKAVTKSVIVYALKDLKAKRLMLAHPMKQFVNRIGLTVSKKIGKATVRNRVKRVIREGLRQTEKSFSTKKGYLLVLVARPAIIEMKSTQVAQDIERALKSLKIIDNENN